MMAQGDEYPLHNDCSWVKLNFKNLFKKHLGVVEVIWVNIVMIWQLETLQDSKFSEIWQHHTMSWLVSFLPLYLSDPL